jgi:arginine exporter protein ArgO
MKKIAIICAFLLVIMAAIMGVLTIFGMMSGDAFLSNMLRFGGAIVVLGVASALVAVMMGNQEEQK